MSKELLLDALSSLEIDVVENYFQEKRDYIERKEKYQNWKKYSITAAVLCILFATVFAMVSMFKNTTHSTNEFQLPVDENEIAWLNDNANISGEESSKKEWNGLTISESLYEALRDMTGDQYIALTIHNADETLLDQFEFQGKEYEIYQKECDELRDYLGKLKTLLKEGELLKYGQLLYLEGTPEGIKWKKELYDDTIAYYGSEFLERYVRDGKFLVADVEADITITKNDISEQEKIMEEAIRAYEMYHAEEIYAQLKETNYCVTKKGSSVFLFITKATFLKFDILNLDRYYFKWASLRNYKGISVDYPELKDEVAGFEINKIHFEGINDEDFVVTTDGEIIEEINRMINIWKYTYDSLEFTIYFHSGKVVDENWFVDMNYTEMEELQYPKRVLLIVPYENVNVEALKNLSQREEISAIYISVPVYDMN